MKNIYIVDEHQTSKRNGIGTYIKEFIYCLQQLNMNICLISFNSDEKEFNIIERVDGIKHIHFPLFEGIFTDHYNVIEKFFRLYIEDSSDNVFFFNHSPCENLLREIKHSHPLSKILFVIHDQRWRVDLMGDCKNLQEIILQKKNEEIKGKYLNIIRSFEIEQRTYNIADGVICLNNDTYSLVRDVYKKIDNLYLIGHGYQNKCGYPPTERLRQRIRARLNIDINEKILIYVGRLEILKGIESLIRSFCKINQEIPNTRLIIIGATPHEKYYNYLFEISREAFPKISFLGQIPHSEIRNWYTVAEIGIFPSYMEQCSFAGIEMMMYGLPIVASDGFGVRCMFKAGVNATIAKRGDNNEEYEKNLTLAIKKLLKSGSLCSILGKSAKKAYEIKYSIENMRDAYKKLLYSFI